MSPKKLHLYPNWVNYRFNMNKWDIHRYQRDLSMSIQILLFYLSLTHTHSCTQNKEFSSFPSNEELQHKLFKWLSSLINHLKINFLVKQKERRRRRRKRVEERRRKRGEGGGGGGGGRGEGRGEKEQEEEERRRGGWREKRWRRKRGEVKEERRKRGEEEEVSKRGEEEEEEEKGGGREENDDNKRRGGWWEEEERRTTTRGGGGEEDDYERRKMMTATMMIRGGAAGGGQGLRMYGLKRRMGGVKGKNGLMRWPNDRGGNGGGEKQTGWRHESDDWWRNRRGQETRRSQ